ncbi:MAG: nitroreductase family deazaflavin-dependent oxidoreductase [Deltaproteobacteria bacterium]|jgi:deazaflavin-dependent oxidoreductase (nitroreductase family)|nr:nitroreductase family deazaflavin-dependent oxidoreductase [Deltaproteobacteria bacterium]
MFTTDDLDRLAASQTIDITTYGRKTGLPRRIEIWWFRVDGRFVITGTPGRRDWIANIMHDPRMIVHVDGRDIETTATAILDWEFRRRVFTQPETSWYSTQEQLDRLVRTAPMIEVHLPSH